MSLHEKTYEEKNIDFINKQVVYSLNYHESAVKIIFIHCPKCKEYSIFIKGIGEKTKDHFCRLKPASPAKQFPNYIPEAILKDYSEASSIVELSPKASATLSRRCLQGMIRDFWNINESNLFKAISELENLIPAQQWRVIDGVRRIGNIGAHMEKDINLIINIDSDEAQKLLKLIELLLQHWYVNKHEEDLLYADIIEIDEEKQSARKNK